MTSKLLISYFLGELLLLNCQINAFVCSVFPESGHFPQKIVNFAARIISAGKQQIP